MCGRPVDSGVEGPHAARQRIVDRSPQSRSKPLAGVRLLIVDDHADCLNALRILLESKGAEVQAAFTVGEARLVFARLRPHVLISDLSLPGEDGFSLLASVRALSRAEGSDTPAVAFSALSPVRAQARAREAGFQAFLRKPGDVLQIVPTVLGLLPSTRPL
jgi:CheY-like chemotaxis protein